MAFIQTVSGDQATGAVADLYRDEEERFGFLPNFSKAFASRPEAYEAWRQLNGAIKGAMDPRRYELATIAAAAQLRSSYCALAHGSVLLKQFMEAGELQAVMGDHRSAGLAEVEVAVMDLAEKVAADATSVTQEDIDRLRSLGVPDADVVDVVLAAAARCFFSKVLDALGVRPDAKYAELEPGIREALTVGHAIAAS